MKYQPGINNGENIEEKRGQSMSGIGGVARSPGAALWRHQRGAVAASKCEKSSSNIEAKETIVKAKNNGGVKYQ
jgi:hypothetical protein